MSDKLFISYELSQKLCNSSNTECKTKFANGDFSIPNVFPIENSELKVVPIGSVHHRLDNSCNYVLLLKPLELYGGVKKHEYNAGDNIEGLEVTCRNKSYVIVEETQTYIDLKTVPLVACVSDVAEAEGKISGYWRSKSQLSGIFEGKGFAYAKHTEDFHGTIKEHYTAFVKSKKGFDSIYLGNEITYVDLISKAFDVEVPSIKISPKNINQAEMQLSLF